MVAFDFENTLDGEAIWDPLSEYGQDSAWVMLIIATYLVASILLPGSHLIALGLIGVIGGTIVAAVIAALIDAAFKKNRRRF